MRCKCCNAPFDAPIIKDANGKIRFEDLCVRCRASSNPSTYSRDFEHANLTEAPIELYE